MNHSKKRYENQLALIEGDNVNISESNDFKSFIGIVSKIGIIVLIVVFSCDLLSDVIVNYMPDKTQVLMEDIISSNSSKHFEFISTNKYNTIISKLNNIKKKIIAQDKNLQRKPDLTLNVIKNKDINAFVLPNGDIYFTSAMLDEGFTEQELAFVLAHELGHYSHRDHLKSASKRIMIALIFSFFGKDNDASRIVNGISETTVLSHSRRQEKNADIYAGKMLKKLYGTNQGGINFINKIKEKEKTPEFLYYFSTHPSWQNRLKTLNQ